MENFMNTNNEIWRDIEGYEGLYEVSNLGRVKSLERIDRHNHLVKERILKPGTDKDGYLRVYLSNEGKVKCFQVHRLVGQTFIPNPEGLPQINHKDEDKTNNVVFLKDDGSVDESNLEWCDCKYNSNYGTRNERRVQTMIGRGVFNPELCGLDKKEHDRLYGKEWFQNNKEKKLEQQREYRQKNREKMREQNRERMRKYRQKNRDKWNEYQRELYRRRKKKQPSE